MFAPKGMGVRRQLPLARWRSSAENNYPSRTNWETPFDLNEKFRSSSFLHQGNRVVLKVKPRLAVGIIWTEPVRFDAVLAERFAKSRHVAFI
jgi:hypothetical protein